VFASALGRIDPRALQVADDNAILMPFSNGDLVHANRPRRRRARAGQTAAECRACRGPSPCCGADARSRPPLCWACRDRACRPEARSAACSADSSPASRAALRTQRGTEGTTRASARTRGRYASRRHQCRGRVRCAGHSGLGNDGRSTSTEPFFRRRRTTTRAKVVAEDALEARGGDEARQREQGTQRPGRLHPWRLTHCRRPGATLRAGTRAPAARPRPAQRPRPSTQNDTHSNPRRPAKITVERIFPRGRLPRSIEGAPAHSRRDSR